MVQAKDENVSPQVEGENLYVLGDPELDRYRLGYQTDLFATYVAANARRLVGEQVQRILDVGCGEGQLGFALLKVYPEAELVGIDRDPKAIEAAQKEAKQRGLQASFIVGDVQETLPPGPFDLAYASLILGHNQRPAATLAHIFNALQPGGKLWVKDFMPNISEVVELPAYRQLTGVALRTMRAGGSHPDIIEKLPVLLYRAGYRNVYSESEEYPIAGPTKEGQIILAVTLGGLYNARSVIAQYGRMSAEEQESLYIEIANAAVLSSEPLGTMPLFNLVAGKPELGKWWTEVVDKGLDSDAKSG